MTESAAAKSPGETFALTMERRLKAAPQRVFEAWTKVEAVAQWMGPPGVTAPDAELDLREGGHYRFPLCTPEGKVHTAIGSYREIAPPDRLVFTWSWEEGEDAYRAEMLITLTFAATADGGTLMTLTQEQITTENARDEHSHGWTGCLDCLENYLAAA